MNKKGSLLDGILLGFFFIGILVSGLVFLTVGNDVFSDDQLGTELQKSVAGNTTVSQFNKMNTGGGLDNMLLIWYVVSHLIVLVLAAVLPINIIFLVITAFFMSINLVTGYAVQQATTSLIDVFNVATIPKTLWVAEHIVLLEVVWSALIIIAMFILGRNRQ